jgi:DNA-binding Lrp family transcriptional regulator
MIESYEKLERNGTLKRISVLLDERTLNALIKLVNKKHLKISDVVRLSIMYYSQHELGDRSGLEDLEKYAHYLTDGSHLIVDIEMLTSLLSETNEKKPDSFWKDIETDGHRHGVYYKSVGIEDLEEILKQMEIKNWFKLRLEPGGCYFLILPSPEIQKFLKHFLRGLFEALDMKLEIKEIGTRNLIIREHFQRSP